MSIERILPGPAPQPEVLRGFRAATCGSDLPAGGDIQFGDLQSDAGSGPEDDDSIRGDNR